MHSLELTSEPEEWSIELLRGGQLIVAAHGYSEEGTNYVFSLLMQGEPCFELTIAKIPVSVVSKIRGG